MTMQEFRNQLARLHFVNRDDLPLTQDWDEDWPSFRDNPYRYFVVCSERHQADIWAALERDRVLTPAQHRERIKSAIEAARKALT